MDQVKLIPITDSLFDYELHIANLGKNLPSATRIAKVCIREDALMLERAVNSYQQRQDLFEDLQRVLAAIGTEGNHPYVQSRLAAVKQSIDAEVLSHHTYLETLP